MRLTGVLAAAQDLPRALQAAQERLGDDVSARVACGRVDGYWEVGLNAWVSSLTSRLRAAAAVSAAATSVPGNAR